MTTQARDAWAIAVLVACTDRNFQRYAQAVLRQAGHTAFSSAVRREDVAVQIRLRSPLVVVLDADHADAAAVRAAVRRIAVVEVSDDPALTRGTAVGKWGSAPELLDAVEQAAAATCRRSLLYVVRP